MKILVLGGGAQGRVIAAELARALPNSAIGVADVREPVLPDLANLRWLEADLSDHAAVGRLLHDHELGVCALPSRLGFATMRAAIEARRPLVDVSLTAQNPLTLDRDARAAGITIVPDCGVAPGLSNLLIGHAVANHGTPEEVMILAGGVAEDSSAPYGYVVTWSLDDLLEEYQRPARIIDHGRRTTVPVFSGLERLQVDGVGEMEAFYSDGLRTLLDTLPDVRLMGEKTLRWPGHVEAVRPLVAISRLVDELRERCTFDPPRDLVVLVVRMRWGKRTRRMTLVERYDSVSGLTAMARSNALTTAAVAMLAAEGGLGEPGIRPLEMLGRDERAYRFVIDSVERHGVQVRSAQA